MSQSCVEDSFSDTCFLWDSEYLRQRRTRAGSESSGQARERSLRHTPRYRRSQPAEVHHQDALDRITQGGSASSSALAMHQKPAALTAMLDAIREALAAHVVAGPQAGYLACNLGERSSSKDHKGQGDAHGGTGAPVAFALVICAGPEPCVHLSLGMPSLTAVIGRRHPVARGRSQGNPLTFLHARGA